MEAGGVAEVLLKKRAEECGSLFVYIWDEPGQGLFCWIFVHMDT